MTQVVKDIQEALLREIAGLATQVKDTQTNISTNTSFDIFTGEALPQEIEGNLYNESSSPNEVEYPRVDLSYTGIREDKESGRMISIWEDNNTDYRELIWPNQNRPRVYGTVLSGTNGVTTAGGLQVGTIQFRKIQTNYLIKIVSGNNLGTYTIDSLDSNTFTVVLNSTLVEDIQELSFNESTRKLYLLNPMDLYNVRSGDIFRDSNSGDFTIMSVNTAQREIYLDGSGIPALDVGSSILRSGPVLRHIDSNPIIYIVMDPDKPLTSVQCPVSPVTDSWDLSHPATPFDYYFTIEIKNKDQPSHISMADQMTHTIINRPRRKLQVLLRDHSSAESFVLEGPDSGIGQSITVADASKFLVNDSVWFINKFSISENNQVIDVDYANNVVTVRNKIPKSYSFKNKAVMVTNARMKSWGMMLDGDPSIGQDNVNNFYRQEYTFRVQGYKSERSGIHTEAGIQRMELELQSENLAVETIKV